MTAPPHYPPAATRTACPACPAALPLLALLAAFAAAGCSRAVQVDNPFPIAADEYHPVYEATIDVLRRHRFALDRQDRRFGVVTAGPLVAASVFEPWHDDNTTAYQVAESTLNHQRRRVRVQIQPVAAPEDAEAANDAAEDEPPDAAVHRTEDYELFVQVIVERRQHPPRALTGETLAAVDLRRRPRLHDPIVTEEGLIESHWRPLRRDHELEQRLIAAIIRRSLELTPNL